MRPTWVPWLPSQPPLSVQDCLLPHTLERYVPTGLAGWAWTTPAPGASVHDLWADWRGAGARRCVPVIFINSAHMPLEPPPYPRASVEWSVPERRVGGGGEDTHTWSLFSGVTMEMQHITLGYETVGEDAPMRPRVYFTGGPTHLWWGYPAHAVLPRPLAAHLVMPSPEELAPVQLTGDHGEHNRATMGAILPLHPLTRWLWVMRIMLPRLASVMWAAPPRVAWATRRTLELLDRVVLRTVRCMRAVQGGYLAAWEHNEPSPDYPGWDTMWHSNLYQTFLHPLAEPWIRTTEDARAWSESGGGGGRVGVLGGGGGRGGTSRGANAPPAEDPAILCTVKSKEGLRKLTYSWPRNGLHWVQQRLTVSERLWGPTSLVLAAIERGRRTSSDPRLSWLAWVWGPTGPWGAGAVRDTAWPAFIPPLPEPSSSRRRGGGRRPTCGRGRGRGKSGALPTRKRRKPEPPTPIPAEGIEWDPYSLMLLWFMDPEHARERKTRLINPTVEANFYWPWVDADHLFLFGDKERAHWDGIYAHSSLACVAIVCVTALVMLERFTYQVAPEVAFAARAARAAWMPMFTQVMQARSPLFNGLPTPDDVGGQAPPTPHPMPTAPHASLTDAWLMAEVLDSSDEGPGTRRIHTLWPDPDGVLTWEQLPNRTDVLHELRLWALHRPLRSSFARIMDKAMLYRSKSRKMGRKFKDAYDDPPPMPPPPPPPQKMESRKKRAELTTQWLYECTQAAEFRALFNQISWCTFQGLYERAEPPRAGWEPALAAHRAWTVAGPRGVAHMLGSTGLSDAKWHMVVLVVMRDYFTAMLGVNTWYVQVIRGHINVEYMVRRTREMTDALRASVNEVCDMRTVIAALQPYKQNNKKKQVYRYERKSCLWIVRERALRIISAAMTLYIAIRTDILPRLRKGLPLLAAHVERIVLCLQHLATEDGPDLAWLRGWVAAGAAVTTTPELIAVLGANACAGEAHPHTSVTPLMAALDALCMRLSWPLSGQCTANIWNYLSRCPPSLRTFVAPFTQPELGGLSRPTAKIIQTILLSDPIALGPKRVDQSFQNLPLWDARILVWWARTVGILNGVRLVPQPQCIMESAQWAKWRTLEASYGTIVGKEIVIQGGALPSNQWPWDRERRAADEAAACRSDDEASGTALPTIYDDSDDGMIMDMLDSQMDGMHVSTTTMSSSAGPLPTASTPSYHPLPPPHHPQPATTGLPDGMWTVLHTRCCNTVSSKQAMERVGYHFDMGCMVCSDGIPRRHSAPPASTDANKTRRIVDSMRPMAHFDQFYGFWGYDARAEQARYGELTEARWATTQGVAGTGLGSASDIQARLALLRGNYENELRTRVAMAGDIIKEEKRDGQQLGSHRTARTLVMLAAEIRALQTGDPTYRVPLADMHDILCESTRSAVSMGFWWIAEHQLLVTHGNAPPVDTTCADAFWRTLIPDAGHFIDRALSRTLQVMDTNLEIGGTGTSTLGSGNSTPTDADWDKFVRSARGILLREACVNVPVQVLYVRGMRLVHGCEDMGVQPIVYSHCPACGAWKPENPRGSAGPVIHPKRKPWGWLAGLWVCPACVPTDVPEHKCMHGVCKVHHPHGHDAIVPLLFHREAALCPPPGARRLPLFTPYKPGIDISPDLADAWSVTWWCRAHHGIVSYWAMYWASAEQARDKLGTKKATNKKFANRKFHGTPTV